MDNIEANIFELSQNENGTHFIKKLISTFHEGLVKRIFEQVIKYFKVLSVHKQGIIVIKNLMTKYQKDNYKKRLIMANLLKDSYKLVQDKFGNYLITHALEIYEFSIC